MGIFLVRKSGAYNLNDGDVVLAQAGKDLIISDACDSSSSIILGCKAGNLIKKEVEAKLSVIGKVTAEAVQVVDKKINDNVTDEKISDSIEKSDMETEKNIEGSRHKKKWKVHN